MLALTLSILFAVAAIAVFISLADSYMRGYNAFRRLRHAVGEMVPDTRITFVSLSNEGALPGFQRSDTRRQRQPTARRPHTTRAAA